MSPRAHTRFGLFVPAILVALASPALAERATLDQEFLDSEIPRLQALADSLEQGAVGPLETLEAARTLSATRHEALLQLDRLHPLTTFDGIETQDRYDLEVTRRLYDVLDAGFHADSTAAPAAVVKKFADTLGPFPDLGPTPVGFMVMGMVDLVVAAYDELLQKDPEVSRVGAAKAATQLLYAGAYLHHLAHEDQFADANSSDFRYSSVILRLRCPKDGGTYRIVSNKNKVNKAGEISTVYALECTTCKTTREIEFKLELQSRLNQMADRQKMKKKSKIPEEGLNP